LLAGIFIAYARPGAIATLAAALLLFTPRSFFVLWNGWVESQVVMLIAATVFCAIRAPRLAPWVFGLLLASKQYNVLMLPAAILLLSRPWSIAKLARFYGIAVIVGMIVTAPLALMDLRTFWWDTVGFHSLSAWRADSLSLPVWMGKDYAGAPWGWLSVAIVIGATALWLWRLPRAPWAFSAAVGLTLLCLFAVSVKAHLNYYYLVIGCLCCAISAAVPSGGTAQPQPDSSA
jgi:hypothetical protein